jgi:hypothetical protein
MDAGAWPSLRCLRFTCAGLANNIAVIKGLLRATGPGLRELSLGYPAYLEETLSTEERSLLACLHVLEHDTSLVWRSSLTTLELQGISAPLVAPVPIFTALETVFLVLPHLKFIRTRAPFFAVVFAVVDTMARGGLQELRELSCRGHPFAAASLLMLHVWRKYGAPHQVLRLRGNYKDIAVGKWMARQQELECQGN